MTSLDFDDSIYGKIEIRALTVHAETISKDAKSTTADSRRDQALHRVILHPLQTTDNFCIILHPKSARIYFILITALETPSSLVRYLVTNAKRYGRNSLPNNVSAFLLCKFITNWF